MTNKLTEINSKFYQEHGIIMLPVKDSREVDIVIGEGEGPLRLAYESKTIWYKEPSPLIYKYTQQHLYFISDKEIKAGNWYYDVKLNRVYQSASGHNNEFYKEKPRYLKVIATTDKLLLTCNGVKREGESCSYNNNCKFPKCQYPRPSNEFLSKFCKLGGIDKVLVEMEEINFDASVFGGKSEILSIPFLQQIKVASDNTITCKPVQEEKKTWNKAEVEVLCRNAFMRKDVGKGLPFDYTDTSCDKWIKENLK